MKLTQPWRHTYWTDQEEADKTIQNFTQKDCQAPRGDPKSNSISYRFATMYLTHNWRHTYWMDQKEINETIQNFT